MGLSAGPTQAQGIPLPGARPGARKMPASFLWGVSTAGHQIEGNNVNSDAWLMENVKPTIFQERSGDACDSLSCFQQDIELVKALGFNSYRFSIDYRGVGPNPVADAVREDRWPVDGGGEEKRPSVGGFRAARTAIAARSSLACRTPPTLRTLHP